MPIAAAPLEALAAFGKWPLNKHYDVRSLIGYEGFIAVGIPLYFITRYNFKQTAYESPRSGLSTGTIILPFDRLRAVYMMSVHVYYYRLDDHMQSNVMVSKR